MLGKIEESLGNGIAPDSREFKISPNTSAQYTSRTPPHKIRTGERSDVSRPIPGAALYWIGTLVIGGLTSCRKENRFRGSEMSRTSQLVFGERSDVSRPMIGRYLGVGR